MFQRSKSAVVYSIYDSKRGYFWKWGMFVKEIKKIRIQHQFKFVVDVI